MFEKTGRHCPRCGYEIRDEFAQGETFVCSVCQSRFRVILDQASGKAAFYEESAGELPEPLHLPKGSIRALMALATSGCCWVLIMAGREVPAALLSLLLAVLGYYFGFRVAVKAAGSRMYDPTAVETAPLHLPGGVVRKLLIAGFVFAGGVLLYRGTMMQQPEYLEFFLILAGLVAGYIFGKIFSAARVGRTVIALNHVKGAVVLAAAAYLCVLLLTGRYERTQGTALCAVVSFYYGSRS